MADYKLTPSGRVVRTADNVFIPDDPSNADRIAYDAWVDDSGVPDAAAETELAAEKTLAKGRADARALTATKELLGDEYTQAYRRESMLEAALVLSGYTTSASIVPLLNSRIGEDTGWDTISDVAAEVNNIQRVLRGDLATIEGTRQTEYTAIEAAATVEALHAIGTTTPAP